VSGSREPKADMVAEGGLWRRDSPCFPERNRGLFVKMKNQNLKKECRACGCTTTGRSTLAILQVGSVGGGAKAGTVAEGGLWRRGDPCFPNHGATVSPPW